MKYNNEVIRSIYKVNIFSPIAHKDAVYLGDVNPPDRNRLVPPYNLAPVTSRISSATLSSITHHD